MRHGEYKFCSAKGCATRVAAGEEDRMGEERKADAESTAHVAGAEDGNTGLRERRWKESGHSVLGVEWWWVCCTGYKGMRSYETKQRVKQ